MLIGGLGSSGRQTESVAVISIFLSFFFFFQTIFFFICIIEDQYVTNEKFNETLCPRGAGPIPPTDYEISYFPSHRGVFFNIAQYKCLVPPLGRSAEATQRRRELQRDIT